jgi:hypothetical protein
MKLAVAAVVAVAAAAAAAVIAWISVQAANNWPFFTSVEDV